MKLKIVNARIPATAVREGMWIVHHENVVKVIEADSTVRFNPHAEVRLYLEGVPGVRSYFPTNQVTVLKVTICLE